MNVETILAKLKKGHSGRFRALKPRELIEDGDIQVGHGWYSQVSHQNVAMSVTDETIIRLEFDK